MVLLSPSLEKGNLRNNQCRRKRRKKESLEGRANWLCLSAELSPLGLVTGTWGSAFRWWTLVYGPRKRGPTCGKDQVIASDSPHTGAQRSRNTSQDAETRLKHLPAESIWNMSSEHERAGAGSWGEEACICWSVRADSEMTSKASRDDPATSQDKSQSSESAHERRETGLREEFPNQGKKKQLQGCPAPARAPL